MSLLKYVSVGCDRCLVPCGGTEDMADNAYGARRVAQQKGWYRIDGLDFCPPCALSSAGPAVPVPTATEEDSHE